MSDIPLPPPFEPEMIIAEAAKACQQKIYGHELAKLVEDLLKVISLKENHITAAVMLSNYLLSEGYGQPAYESGMIKETDAMGREKFWEDAGRPIE
jgi:hypothetical protein